MRGLLDVNVIIALLDPDHSFHNRAHVWWKANANKGWASCPITENGFVRIVSNPGYSQHIRFSPRDLISRLQTLTAGTDHQFWSDDISLRDEAIFAADHIHSGRQLTDLYLLALAAKHRGRLVSFDMNIPISAVKTAKSANLCLV